GGGTAGEGGGGGQRAEAEAGVAHRPARRQRRVAPAARGDGGHEGGVRHGEGLVADAQEQRGDREQPRGGRGARRGGQQQRGAADADQHGHGHGHAPRAAVQPAAHRGGAAGPGGHARRHGQAGGHWRQPQRVDAIQDQEGPQQAGATRVNADGEGVSGATGGADEGAEADAPRLP